MLWHLILVNHCTIVLMIFLLIFVIELISRWTCWSVIRTFSLWRPQSHHIYDLYESCGGRGSYSFSASWSVGSASGRKSSLLVQCGVTRNLWFKVSLIIYYCVLQKVFCGLLFLSIFVVLYFFIFYSLIYYWVPQKVFQGLFVVLYFIVFFV